MTGTLSSNQKKKKSLTFSHVGGIATMIPNSYWHEWSGI